VKKNDHFFSPEKSCLNGIRAILGNVFAARKNKFSLWMQPNCFERRLLGMFQKLNFPYYQNMKTIATFFAALFLSLTMLYAAPGSNTSMPIYDSNGLAMHVLGNGKVKAGNTISIELNSTFEALAELSVENSDGKQLVDTPIEIQAGVNVLKFSVSEIPAGIYFVKVKTESKTETLAIVVQ
jgi:hypothetical protein